MKRKVLEKLLSEVREVWKIERLILEGKISQEDVGILKAMAERGIPRAEYDCGLFFLLCLNDADSALEWFEKCKKHANEHLMSKISVANLVIKEDYSQ